MWMVRGLYACVLMLVVVLPSSGVVSAHRPRAITQCSWGGNTFSLYDFPRPSTVGSYNLVTINGEMLHPNAPGAAFTIQHSGKVIFRKQVDDVYDQNGWIGSSNDFHSFSINTSNGGAGGGWSVTILGVSDEGKVVDLSKSMLSVQTDFESRHFCKARGDNYEAIQWRKNDQLLISASVYGTSDCGKEMGYTEGYVLEVTTGRIVAHVSEAQMLDLPYVCTYNVWQPGDPNP